MDKFPHTKAACELSDQYRHWLHSPEDVEQMLAERDQELPESWLKEQWWTDTHYKAAVHFATTDEVHEMLDLWLELGKTFTSDRYVEAVNGLVESPFEAAERVAGLLDWAKVKLGEADEKRLQEKNLCGVKLPEKPTRMDYLWVAPKVERQFESEYLQNASRIVAARRLLDCISDFYNGCEWRAKRFNEADELADQLESMSRWRHPIKRFKMAQKCITALDIAYQNEEGVRVTNRRVIDAMHLCYLHTYEYGYPLAKRAVALRKAGGKFFDDADLQKCAFAEWEASEIYQKFGEEKILRAHMLRYCMAHTIIFFRPEAKNEAALFNKPRYTEQEVRALYPDFPEELYDYCEFA